MLPGMIAIIDYGMGNLRSVQKGCEKGAMRPKSPVRRNALRLPPG